MAPSSLGIFRRKLRIFAGKNFSRPRLAGIHCGAQASLELSLNSHSCMHTSPPNDAMKSGLL